jgi:hypothetical protein
MGLLQKNARREEGLPPGYTDTLEGTGPSANSTGLRLTVSGSAGDSIDAESSVSPQDQRQRAGLSRNLVQSQRGAWAWAIS